MILASCSSSDSCTDGIKNGDEINVDCGGSDCLPCVGVDPEISIYNNESFAGDWQLISSIWPNGEDLLDIIVVKQYFTFYDDGNYDFGDFKEFSRNTSSGTFNVMNDSLIMIGSNLLTFYFSENLSELTIYNAGEIRDSTIVNIYKKFENTLCENVVCNEYGGSCAYGFCVCTLGFYEPNCTLDIPMTMGIYKLAFDGLPDYIFNLDQQYYGDSTHPESASDLFFHFNIENSLLFESDTLSNLESCIPGIDCEFTVNSGFTTRYNIKIQLFDEDVLMGEGSENRLIAETTIRWDWILRDSIKTYEELLQFDESIQRFSLDFILFDDVGEVEDTIVADLVLLDFSI